MPLSGLERSRPIKANDPAWPILDLDLKPSSWKALIRMARDKGVPVAVVIREILTREMDRLERLGEE